MRIGCRGGKERRKKKKRTRWSRRGRYGVGGVEVIRGHVVIRTSRNARYAIVYVPFLPCFHSSAALRGTLPEQHPLSCLHFVNFCPYGRSTSDGTLRQHRCWSKLRYTTAVDDSSELTRAASHAELLRSTLWYTVTHASLGLVTGSKI